MAEAKYNIGDIVHCFREGDFDFTGKVLSKADTGDIWEYDVSGAPLINFTLYPRRCLIWESEIISKEES